MLNFPINRIIVLLIAPLPALTGQDFFGVGMSAQTAARAGIYVPDASNALDALALNPAGLASLTGPVANLSALGLLARGDFSNATNNGSPMRFNAGAVPYGAFGLPLGSRWSVAVGFVPDLLSSAKWRFQDAPGVAGANYGPQSETSQILAFRGTAGVAYRVSSRLSLGATVGAIYNSNTLIMPYVFQSNPDLKGLKTLLDLHTTGVGWNAGFGATAKLSRDWELGASYRTGSSITSSGSAAGSLNAQFAASGIPFPPSFAYHAQVKVQMPQAALLNLAWQQSPVLRLTLQSTWTGWNDSFNNLPVSLTGGTNAGIDNFLQSTGIKDVIPLAWKDQFSFAAAADRQFGESFSLSGGYMHQNDPVPASTLTPLTAAIMRDGLTAGFGYRKGRARFDAAYQFFFSGSQTVGTSALLSGEFDNSRVRVGTQALILSTSFRL